jgi:hypothetical protein
MNAIHSISVRREVEHQESLRAAREPVYGIVGLSQHRFFCECGNIVTAPSASAYVEPSSVRHRWVCDSCHRTFETLIEPDDEAAPRETPI